MHDVWVAALSAALTTGWRVRDCSLGDVGSFKWHYSELHGGLGTGPFVASPPPGGGLCHANASLERRMSRTASAAGATHGATHARARGDGAQP